MRNDPIFGFQPSPRRESKDNKAPPKQGKGKETPIKTPTIAATDVKENDKTTSAETCKICKSRRHKLQNCPVIKQCDLVTVRKQFAVTYGYCFNCGLEKPGHGSASCPEPPACAKCSGRHLTLLHLDSYNNSNQLSRGKSVPKDKSDKTPGADADST